MQILVILLLLYRIQFVYRYSLVPWSRIQSLGRASTEMGTRRYTILLQEIEGQSFYEQVIDPLAPFGRHRALVPGVGPGSNKLVAAIKLCSAFFHPLTRVEGVKFSSFCFLPPEMPVFFVPVCREWASPRLLQSIFYSYNFFFFLSFFLYFLYSFLSPRLPFFLLVPLLPECRVK